MNEEQANLIELLPNEVSLISVLLQKILLLLRATLIYFTLIADSGYIFAYLRCEDRLTVRLVNRLWYKLCSRNEHIFFRGPPFAFDMNEDDPDYPEIPFEHLKNYQFQRPNFHFEYHKIEDFPVTVLEKIGARVQLLSFFSCKLGVRVLKNVILHCNDLRKLSLKGHEFCSLHVLEELDTVHTKLHSLSITKIRAEDEVAGSSDDYETWERTFKSLLRIFPNIVHFSMKNDCQETEEIFKCEFSTELHGEYEPSLVSVLAHTMCNSVEDWRKAFKALSSLRFVYLHRIRTRKLFLIPIFTLAHANTCFLQLILCFGVFRITHLHARRYGGTSSSFY